ncbi:MAG: efflux RND transporter periplasmic adaptor subunit [Alphaproteobacteria bacterium]|nr:efflux RND transporter periplasmic adaptor subunit [Alphaproteobacteria bacterium]
MMKRMIIMLVLVGLVLGGVFAWLQFGHYMMTKAMSASSNPPQTVSTVKAEMLEWQPELKAVGTLRAVKGADLSAEVEGIVDEIHFESGDDVEEGKTLMHLRDADDVARLKSLEATAKLAEITLQRDMKQVKVQAVSQATVDADTANLNSALAQVEQQKAVVAKKTIRAPFAGHVGIRSVDIGQYLNPGMAVVTLQQLDPIYIDFYLPEQLLPQVQMGQKVTAKTDAHPGKALEGDVTALNAKVDPATRNILIRATLKNPERLLLPGMFANVNVVSGTPQRYITLPQTAITYNPYGNTVYIVETKGTNEKGEPQLTAKQTFVTTGETRGDQIAVLSGVKEDDAVVSSGQIKLRNGSPVVINNNIQPANEANPKPEDY